MSIIHAIVLGVVQGFTEFLPISSSGHLILFRDILGWSDPSVQVDRTFDVAVHLGSLVAVVAYFRRDLSHYARAGARSVRTRSLSDLDGRIAWLLVVATLPAVLLGAVFGGAIDEHLTGPVVVGLLLAGFGVLLGLADRLPARRLVESLRLRDGWTLGAAQALALVPGTSRAGITMTAGRAIGFDRDTAARLSFLMAVPVTFAAAVYVGARVVRDGVPDGMAVPFALGIVTSGITAYLAIAWLLRFLRTHSFLPFVVYRVALGGVILAWAALR